jgi:hypothetical protein
VSHCGICMNRSVTCLTWAASPRTHGGGAAKIASSSTCGPKSNAGGAACTPELMVTSQSALRMVVVPGMGTCKRRACNTETLCMENDGVSENVRVPSKHAVRRQVPWALFVEDGTKVGTSTFARTEVRLAALPRPPRGRSCMVCAL